MQMGKETSLQSARSAAKRTRTDQSRESQLPKNLLQTHVDLTHPPPPASMHFCLGHTPISGTAPLSLLHTLNHGFAPTYITIAS